MIYFGLFLLFWIVMGALTVYSLVWYQTNYENDEDITLEMIPMIILMGAIWPITAGVIFHEWWKKNKNMTVWSPKKKEDDDE